MTQDPSVLVTYGWCRVSFVILHSLASRGIRVHVADHSNFGMCRFSRAAASFDRYRNPYTDAEGFVEDLIGCLERTGAGVLIPGHEDILPIARMKARFPSKVRIPVGNADDIALVSNKWQLMRVAAEAGVETPLTFKAGSLTELDGYLRDARYPLVIKPQIGNSAKGVYVVDNAAEARARFDEVVQTHALPPDRWPIVQEFVPGSGYGVCLLYNQGELRASFAERYLRCKDGDLGTSVFRESVDAPELVERATALMRPFKWHGVVHLDFLYDQPSGRAALIEVNPRFWGALDLAVRAGMDFPWLLYRMAVDGDVDLNTSYRVGVRSRWVAGEILHLVNHLRRGRIGRATHAATDVLRERADGFDDFRLNDPVPLMAELLYYGTRFLATRSANPIEEGMIA